MFFYEPPRTDEKLDPTGPEPGEVVVLADVDCSVLDELVETLKKYRLRSKVDIENAGEEFSCWQRYGVDLHKRAPSSLEDSEAASVGWGGTSTQREAHLHKEVAAAGNGIKILDSIA